MQAGVVPQQVEVNEPVGIGRQDELTGIPALRNMMRCVDRNHASKTSHETQGTRKPRALQGEKRWKTSRLPRKSLENRYFHTFGESGAHVDCPWFCRPGSLIGYQLRPESLNLFTCGGHARRKKRFRQRAFAR